MLNRSEGLHSACRSTGSQVAVMYEAVLFYPGGSRYLTIKEFGLKDHDYYGFWGLSPW